MENTKTIAGHQCGVSPSADEKDRWALWVDIHGNGDHIELETFDTNEEACERFSSPEFLDELEKELMADLDGLDIGDEDFDDLDIIDGDAELDDLDELNSDDLAGLDDIVDLDEGPPTDDDNDSMLALDTARLAQEEAEDELVAAQLIEADAAEEEQRVSAVAAAEVRVAAVTAEVEAARIAELQATHAALAAEAQLAADEKRTAADALATATARARVEKEERAAREAAAKGRHAAEERRFEAAAARRVSADEQAAARKQRAVIAARKAVELEAALDAEEKRSGEAFIARDAADGISPASFTRRSETKSRTGKAAAVHGTGSAAARASRDGNRSDSPLSGDSRSALRARARAAAKAKHNAAAAAAKQQRSKEVRARRQRAAAAAAASPITGAGSRAAARTEAAQRGAASGAAAAEEEDNGSFVDELEVERQGGRTYQLAQLRAVQRRQRKAERTEEARVLREKLERDKNEAEWRKANSSSGRKALLAEKGQRARDALEMHRLERARTLSREKEEREVLAARSELARLERLQQEQRRLQRLQRLRATHRSPARMPVAAAETHATAGSSSHSTRHASMRRKESPAARARASSASQRRASPNTTAPVALSPTAKAMKASAKLQPNSDGRAFAGKKKKSTMSKGWKAVTDKASGRVYYYNKKTRKTSWTLPKATDEKALVIADRGTAYVGGHGVGGVEGDATAVHLSSARGVELGEGASNVVATDPAPSDQADEACGGEGGEAAVYTSGGAAQFAAEGLPTVDAHAAEAQAVEAQVTAEGKGEATNEMQAAADEADSSRTFLAPLGLVQYIAVFDENGYELAVNCEDMGVAELTAELGMVAEDAQKLTEYFHAPTTRCAADAGKKDLCEEHVAAEASLSGAAGSSVAMRLQQAARLRTIG